MQFSRSALAACVLVVCGSNVAAAVCDYRPSVNLGSAPSSAIVGAGGAAAVGGAAMKAAGFYTLVHAGSGLTMLGSTLAGASGAGTIGIIAGTGGVLGTVGAVLMAPATLIAGGVALVGVGGLEAGCYFQDERVTDYNAVLNMMEHFAANHPEDRFALVRGIEGREDDAILIWNPGTGELDRYLIADLYIVNGTLMHRKWGPNRNLGQITYVDPEADPLTLPPSAQD